MKRVGLIGLGLLGSALAERLRVSGFEVIAFDIDEARRREFAASGGTLAESSGDVAQRCDRLLLSLPDTAAVESVLIEITPQLRPGAVVADTTTGDPEGVAELGAKLAGQGIDYLSATVLGSSDEARAGEVVVMIGGGQQAYESCLDIFASFAKRMFQVGHWGAAARMKLVVNLVLGLNRAVLAEGLQFARSLGFEAAGALEILRAGAAHSRVMDTKGPKMCAEDFSPQARLSQHLKDVRLIVEAAQRCRAKIPLSQLHRQILENLVAVGYGDQDNSAVIRAFD